MDIVLDEYKKELRNKILERIDYHESFCDDGDYHVGAAGALREVLRMLDGEA